MPKHQLLITCEHGGNKIPRRYAGAFARASQALESHRGYDFGAAGVARKIAAHFGAPLHIQTVSRLLVDNNRTLHHRKLFSEFSRGLPAEVKHEVLSEHYTPHRRAVEQAVASMISSKRVFHLAVHSFTPVLDGEVRACDVGLLYDPKRTGERTLANEWQRILTGELPGFRMRRNYPYKGAADGLPTYLRRKFPNSYIGFELELNQKHFGTPKWALLEGGVIASLSQLL